MFERFIRLIKSFFNKFLTAAEDPVTILENNIREMKNQIPKLNEGIARANGTVILLKKQYEQYVNEEKQLRAKLRAAALAGEDVIGKDIALQLQRIIREKEKTKEAMTQAEDGLSKLEELRNTQERKINAEVEKIRDTIEASKVAKLKGELAELFQTYQVGDLAYSNQEMIEKLERETATNEGKLVAAAKSPDMAQIRIDKEADEIQAEELYNQFKTEMNIDIASGPDEKQKSKKTISTTS